MQCALKQPKSKTRHIKCHHWKCVEYIANSGRAPSSGIFYLFVHIRSESVTEAAEHLDCLGAGPEVTGCCGRKVVQAEVRALNVTFQCRSVCSRDRCESSFIVQVEDVNVCWKKGCRCCIVVCSVCWMIQPLTKKSINYTKSSLCKHFVALLVFISTPAVF